MAVADLVNSSVSIHSVWLVKDQRTCRLAHTMVAVLNGCSKGI